MKNSNWILFLIVFFVAGIAYGEDTLWQKAVNCAGKNTNLAPGKIALKNEVLDDLGNVKKTVEIWMKLSYATNRKPEVGIEKYLEDSKDVTEGKKQEFLDAQEKKKDQKGQKSISISSEEMNPFLPDGQTNMVFSSQPLSDIIDGKEYVVYEYTRTMKKGEIQKGKAWLSSKTGIPFKVLFTTTPLPEFVTSMSNTVFFKTGLNEEWYPDRLEVLGSGGFLLFKVNIKNTTFFSEYSKSQYVSIYKE
jgi:hypothetical protein